MIIDNNLVLLEHTDTIAAGNGNAVALNSLLIPGKAEPIPVLIKVTEDMAGGTSATIKLQQSDSETGTYTDVTGASETITTANFKAGYKFAWKYLPRNVTKPWIRLNVTVSGTPTAGKLFAAVSGFMDEPYEAGQYIDKGTVVG